jgi:cytosine/uracil/thiamine/allantoin permease
MLNVFMSFVFYGTQMYFGGQAFVIILNALSPDFLHMSNTLPERSVTHIIIRLSTSLTNIYSAGITTPELIGFVLFILLYFPIIYWVPAYKVQKYLEIQVVVATMTLFGIMAMLFQPMEEVQVTLSSLQSHYPRRTQHSRSSKESRASQVLTLAVQSVSPTGHAMESDAIRPHRQSLRLPSLSSWQLFWASSQRLRSPRHMVYCNGIRLLCFVSLNLQ